MSAIRLFSQADIAAIAEIHAESFPRQRHSQEWIAANARAYPRARLYVASIDSDVRGYILWTEKAVFGRKSCQSLPRVAGELAMRPRTSRQFS